MKIVHDQGFTLLEVLISILIIGIISSMTIMSNMNSSKEKANFANIKSVWGVNEGKYIEKLIGKWQFDETGTLVLDSSTFGNSGTISGVTRKTEDSCLNGGCFEFNGTSDFIEIAKVPYTSNWTYSLWINRSADNGTWERLLSYSRSGGSYDRWFQVQPDDSVNSGFVDSTAVSRSVSTDKKIELNKWYYLVATFDGKRVRLYVNGVLDKMSDDFSTNTPRNSNFSFEIGRLGTSSAWTYSFKGLIDEVSVYSDVMTLSGVQKDYVAGLDRLLTGRQINSEDYAQSIKEFNNKLAKK
ncbi:MAG: LamG domain-containing protein [Candidatus Pacebacteria bacterium]|nr:LamG domain-containing protein [Candidatus Paceibacterota bacterium]